MSEANKKEIIKVEGLGDVEVVRTPSVDKNGVPVSGVFSMSQKALEQFYADNGVPEPKKVFKAIDDARTVFAERATEFLGKHVIEKKADFELRAGTGAGSCGRHIISIDAEKDVRNVSTGEVTKKYGVVSFKVVEKAPVKNEIIMKVQADMEAALRPAGL